MFCPTCGKGNALGRKFCVACGTNLGDVSQSARDLGLGEVAFTEKAPTFQPSFFNLLGS
jgi:uncharacterized membrane protein YvbJ